MMHDVRNSASIGFLGWCWNWGLTVSPQLRSFTRSFHGAPKLPRISVLHQLFIPGDDILGMNASPTNRLLLRSASNLRSMRKQSCYAARASCHWPMFMAEVFSQALLCCSACTHLRLRWIICSVTLTGIHSEGWSLASHAVFFPFLCYAHCLRGEGSE